MGSSFLTFHMPALGAQRLAKWLRGYVIVRRGSSLCSEHVDGDCFETRSLLRRDYARGDGSYMRKPGRTSKGDCHPHEACSHTVCRVAMLAQCQLCRGEENSKSVKRYLFVRSWPLLSSVVWCVRVFPLSYSGSKESGVRMNAWTQCVCAYGCTCKLCNTSTVDKKTTVRSAAWRNILHSPERYIPVLTAIRVAVALKVFCQCRNRTVLSKHTHFNTSCIHTHCKPVAPSLPQQQHFFFFFGQHGLSFIFAIEKKQSHLHQQQYPTRDSSGSASALAEMSSQASPRSLGDHLGLHRRPGLTALLSSNYCSKRKGCVRLSPLESLEALHPTQTFSGRLQRRASLSSCQWRKTGPQLAFSVLGTIDVTGHCVIEDRPRRPALSQRAGREDRRRFFANFIVGKDKSMVKFSFWGVLAL